MTARVRGKQIVNLGTVDEAMAGQRVTVIGLLIEPRAMLTKKGTMMLRATLEGVDGVNLDLIAFSEAYERCRENLIADAVIEVDARIDFRGEQLQLIVEAVRICADAEPEIALPREERRIQIWLPPTTDDHLSHQLYELCKAYPGDDLLYLHCQESDGQWKKLLPRMRVDADEGLAAAARALVGAEAVRTDVVVFMPERAYEPFSAD